MEDVRLGFTILLIGGSSGTGKTTVAQILRRRLQTSVLLVDDVRLALQQMTTAEHHPELHIFKDHAVLQRTPEAVREGLITVGTALIPAIKTIIAHHVVVSGSGPLIIEGDGVVPQLALPQVYADLKVFRTLHTSSEVRAVFLYEADPQILFQNFVTRGRGFDALAADEQYNLVHGCWLYGDWIRQQAEAHQLTLLPVRPYETLVDRILNLVSANDGI